VSRRAALVTGAAGGIGRAVAERLIEDGLDVLSVDLEARGEMPGTAFAADLTTREGNRGAVDAALEAFGRLDVVVPNAGVQHVAPVKLFPEDRWDMLLALMLTSPFLLARYAWDLLERGEWGRVVNVSSVHGLRASPNKAAYVAAKHGLEGLSKVIALEGGARGVTSNTICPGYVRTPLVEKQIPDQAKAHGISEEQALEDVILAPHAVKRLIEPEEVAAVVSFLASPAGSAFTGAPVTLDQGWSAR
jgi:3-hydroxybutyrate dehydrogenase